MSGYELVGREINLLWENGSRYDAVVVSFHKRDNEYKLVYPCDDGVEVASIEDRQWRLLGNRSTTKVRPMLVGAIVEVVYPVDKKTYQAMIYSQSDNDDIVKICYLQEYTIDYISGNNWKVIVQSPYATYRNDREDRLVLPHQKSRATSPAESLRGSSDEEQPVEE